MANIDFNALVSRHNPAAAQYRPTHTGYPPPDTDNERQEIFLIDDDDEEDPSNPFSGGGTSSGRVPDSAFRIEPMASKESGLALTRHAAPVAGHDHAVNGTSWLDEEAEELEPIDRLPTSRSLPKMKKKWTWPWEKEETFKGDRLVALNDEVSNHIHGYPSNSIATSKFNIATFLPKFLAGPYCHIA
jgi:phospholipid-transporting ATPase